MARKRIKPRRKLCFSDYRRAPSRIATNFLKCEEHGYIDVGEIERTFPDKVKRLEYIDGLIEGLK